MKRIIIIPATLLFVMILVSSQSAQEDQRARDAAKVQKKLSEISTIKLPKINSLKAFFLELYKEDEGTSEMIKETPENELETVMGLKEEIFIGEGDFEEGGDYTERDFKMVDSYEANSGVINSYLEKFADKIGTAIPPDSALVRNMVLILAKGATLKDVLKAIYYPNKVWRGEFEFGWATLNYFDNPLRKLGSSAKGSAFIKESNPIFKELKDAFISYLRSYLKEDVNAVLNIMAESIYTVGAGPMGRWVKKSEVKSLLAAEFQEEPYSLFSIEDYIHADLTIVAKAKLLPQKPWEAMMANWSVFQDSDYLVAAPSMIGMIDDESLGGGDVEYCVFRKVDGKWMIVGM